ncbi:MAG: EF2563 family selenium-dependent molybdenum hydroxylase system protein [Anaerolineae bacterium]|nr:EF2563 family selenium-dependent molybdenum hydroxylase system protein [Anaerolineae bacterium]
MGWLFPDSRVLIRGAGDLASGVALRLVRAGFPVVMLERPLPLLVRRTVSFGNVIFENGLYSVENVQAVLVKTPEQLLAALEQNAIPVLVDPEGQTIRHLLPSVVVDARMQKQSLDTSITHAPLVIALGPGYKTGQHCHVIIETNRGHRLGRVIWQGTAEVDTGTPGKVAGYDSERVLRAPVSGFVIPASGIKIGVSVKKGDRIASVNNHDIIAPFPGIVRGLIHESVRAEAGLKVGDIDPRNDISYCYSVSDKALAIGGGVLEAILSAPQIRRLLRTSEAVSDVSL